MLSLPVGVSVCALLQAPAVNTSALRSYPVPFAERLAELYCESRGTKRSAEPLPEVSIETNVASLRKAPPGDPWNDATVPAQEKHTHTYVKALVASCTPRL